MRKIRSVQICAFSTSSSNATIPTTLYTTKNHLGIDNSTASFVVPFGATLNMDGTAITHGIATVFIANVYGIDLEIMDYLAVIAMTVLASIGTAGVPGLGLIILAMIFNQIGLPVESIAMILAVDRILDMLRTAVNVTGDMVRNGHAIISLFSIPTSARLPPFFNQLEIEQLFLHFCSIRTNEYGLNPGAKPGSYCVPIPYHHDYCSQ